MLGGKWVEFFQLAVIVFQSQRSCWMHTWLGWKNNRSGHQRACHFSLQYELNGHCFWQVWLCGGSIEVIPCSKIAHIERATKPYLPDFSGMMKRNALRVAEVWLDEYKPNVNIAWNIPLEVMADTSSTASPLFYWKVWKMGPRYPGVSCRIMG